MLAAGQRLRRRDEFTAVLRGGRRAGRGGLVIHVNERVGTGHVGRGTAADNPPTVARAGFVVPRAVGSAVVRNRLRRQLRHALRDRLALLPAELDLVVRVMPAAVGRSYTELGADFDQALRAARTRGSASRTKRSSGREP